MLKLFSSRRKKGPPTRELAPQLTGYQRRAFEYAGLPPAGLAYSVYDQMERDAMIQTALTLKKLGVLAAPYSIVPADRSDQAKRIAEFVEAQFESMTGSPRSILFSAMDAFAKGWSLQELLWEGHDGKLRLAAVKPKDPSQFGLEVDAFGNIERLRLEIPGEAPRDLPAERFVIFQNRPGYGSPKGRSDLDAAHRHWDAKGRLLDGWRQHLDRFAMPTVLGKFESGLSEEDVRSMLNSLQQLGTSTAMTYSDAWQVDTLGGGKEPSAGFMEAIEFHNREIARAILGQTLTTDEGRRVGSLALGKVHLQVLLLQLASLRAQLADLVMTEQVIRPMIELNFGDSPIPRFEFQAASSSAFATGELN